jgi:hypothetical protein
MSQGEYDILIFRGGLVARPRPAMVEQDALSSRRAIIKSIKRNPTDRDSATFRRNLLLRHFASRELSAKIPVGSPSTLSRFFFC